MATIPRVVTYEEWLTMPVVQDGVDEVVNGEYRFMPPTRYPHADIIQRILVRMAQQLDQAKVTILGSNFGLVIRKEPLTCRSPDLALYWRERDQIVDGLRVAAPDLIVEVISRSEDKQRKEAKMSDYGLMGVPEIWLVSWEQKSVEVRMLRNGGLERTEILVDGILKPNRFPGLSLMVKDVWPEPRG